MFLVAYGGGVLAGLVVMWLTVQVRRHWRCRPFSPRARRSRTGIWSSLPLRAWSRRRSCSRHPRLLIHVAGRV